MKKLMMTLMMAFAMTSAVAAELPLKLSYALTATQSDFHDSFQRTSASSQASAAAPTSEASAAEVTTITESACEVKRSKNGQEFSRCVTSVRKIPVAEAYRRVQSMRESAND